MAGGGSGRREKIAKVGSERDPTPAASRPFDLAGGGPALPSTRLPEPQAVAGTLRLTVLFPAHNEGLTVGAALESLCAQTRPPDRVVVVADNCSDDTADVARHHGADVFTTVAAYAALSLGKLIPRRPE
jgi:hypothetical protein